MHDRANKFPGDFVWPESWEKFYRNRGQIRGLILTALPGQAIILTTVQTRLSSARDPTATRAAPRHRPHRTEETLSRSNATSGRTGQTTRLSDPQAPRAKQGRPTLDAGLASTTLPGPLRLHPEARPTRSKRLPAEAACPPKCDRRSLPIERFCCRNVLCNQSLGNASLA